MGDREVIITQTAAEQIASISWYIESKGLTVTAEKFTADAYGFLLQLSNVKKSYALCREPTRAAMGYKSIPYKKKYTNVFIESEADSVILEFLVSKLFYW